VSNAEKGEGGSGKRGRMNGRKRGRGKEDHRCCKHNRCRVPIRAQYN